SSSSSSHSLESKGFLPAVYIRDFPIRDRKVSLCVRRRKWLDTETGSIICNSFELTARGTRHSKEFASFLKGLLGEIPDYGPLS
ncbi:ISAon1 family transposase N-terminal region protein, partial [Bacteroides clarus]